MATPYTIRMLLQRSLLNNSFKSFISSNVQSRIATERNYATCLYLHNQSQTNLPRPRIPVVVTSRMMCSGENKWQEKNEWSSTVMDLLGSIEGKSNKSFDWDKREMDLFGDIKEEIKLNNDNSELDAETVLALLEKIDQASLLDVQKRVLRSFTLKLCCKKNLPGMAWDQFKIIFNEDPNFYERPIELMLMFQTHLNLRQFDEAMQLMEEFYGQYFEHLDKNAQENALVVLSATALSVADNGVDGTTEQHFRCIKSLFPNKKSNRFQAPYARLVDGYGDRGDIEGGLEIYEVMREYIARPPLLVRLMAECIRQNDRQSLEKAKELSLSDRGLRNTQANLLFAFVLGQELQAAKMIAQNIQLHDKVIEDSIIILLRMFMKWHTPQDFQNVVGCLKEVDESFTKHMLSKSLESVYNMPNIGRRLKASLQELQNHCKNDEFIMSIFSQYEQNQRSYPRKSETNTVF